MRRGSDFFERCQEGGGSLGRGGGRGREGVCGKSGGGGLNIFFRARNSHQVAFPSQNEGF